MPQATQTDTTSNTDDHTKSFPDRMVELNVGMKLVLDRLDEAFDAGFELDMKVGSDVMDAIIATQWVAQRLREDISRVGHEFDQDTSDRGKVKFARRPNSPPPAS